MIPSLRHYAVSCQSAFDCHQSSWRCSLSGKKLTLPCGVPLLTARIDLMILPGTHLLSPAVLADTDEIIFSSYLYDTTSNISRLNLGTGEVTLVPTNPKLGQTAGSTLYTDGQVS